MSVPNYRLFKPAYPFVIVQSVPTPEYAQSASGIFLTEKPHTPIREGIVLATWDPWAKRVGTVLDPNTEAMLQNVASWNTPQDAPGPAWSMNQIAKVLLDGCDTWQRMESQVKTGDRVFYTHTTRFADPSEPEVQFVREGGEPDTGAILGFVRNDYETAQVLLAQELYGKHVQMQASYPTINEATRTAEALLEKFVVTPKTR